MSRVPFLDQQPAFKDKSLESFMPFADMIIAKFAPLMPSQEISYFSDHQTTLLPSTVELLEKDIKDLLNDDSPIQMAKGLTLLQQTALLSPKIRPTKRKKVFLSALSSLFKEETKAPHQLLADLCRHLQKSNWPFDGQDPFFSSSLPVDLILEKTKSAPLLSLRSPVYLFALKALPAHHEKTTSLLTHILSDLDNKTSVNSLDETRETYYQILQSCAFSRGSFSQQDDSIIKKNLEKTLANFRKLTSKLPFQQKLADLFFLYQKHPSSPATHGIIDAILPLLANPDLPSEQLATKNWTHKKWSILKTLSMNSDPALWGSTSRAQVFGLMAPEAEKNNTQEYSIRLIWEIIKSPAFVSEGRLKENLFDRMITLAHQGLSHGQNMDFLLFLKNERPPQKTSFHIQKRFKETAEKLPVLALTKFHAFVEAGESLSFESLFNSWVLNKSPSVQAWLLADEEKRPSFTSPAAFNARINHKKMLSRVDKKHIETIITKIILRKIDQAKPNKKEALTADVLKIVKEDSPLRSEITKMYLDAAGFKAPRKSKNSPKPSR